MMPLKKSGIRVFSAAKSVFGMRLVKRQSISAASLAVNRQENGVRAGNGTGQAIYPVSVGARNSFAEGKRIEWGSYERNHISGQSAI